MSLEVRVLGRLELIGDARSIHVGPAKERELLCLLVLNQGHVLPADQIAHELWEGRPAEQGVAAVRVYISHLRQALGGEVIKTLPPGYQLQLDPGRLDSTRFQALARQGYDALSGGGDPQRAASSFNNALSLWRGPPYEDVGNLTFARAECARLQEARLAALEGRIEADLACGRHAELVGELEVLCSNHPLREGLWGQRMVALYRSGRQAEALSAYQQLRRLLSEELGIDPCPEVGRLQAAVLAQDPTLDWQPPAASAAIARAPTTEAVRSAGAVLPFPLPTALRSETTAFVGRQAELALLAEAWDRAKDARRQMVLVSGEPGIGKTSLMLEAARAAHAGGAVVLFGRCNEESLVPFQPFVEALADYVNFASAETLRAPLGEQGADLALLLPELCRRFPDLAQPSGSVAETERYRLFEAVSAFISSIAAQSPIVLILDDLHWADRPTLQLLLHTLRRTDRTPLLVLASYRDTDLVPTHPMTETLVDLRRVGLVDRLRLRGLSRENVNALVAGDGEATPGDLSLAEALWGETEGNPLFIREILRHLAETGVIAQRPDGGYEALRRIEQLGIPEGVKEVIGRRFTRLSDETNTVLKTASVVGREFGVNLVAEVSTLPIDRALDAVDEATAAGLIAEVDGATGRYAFTHALIRETLYDELSLTRRIRLHTRVGEAIEDLHRSGLDPYLSELAYHFGQAAASGEAEKAVDYATRAGKRAMSLFAFEEASRHFANALEIVEDMEGTEERRADLLLAMGEAQWRARDHKVARATFELAAQAARALGDSARLAKAALGYAGAQVRWIWVEVGRFNKHVVALLEEAVSALSVDDSALRARVLGALACELHFEPDSTRAEEFSLEAVAVARRVGDPATLAYVLSARNLATSGLADPEERLANADEALRLADVLHDSTLASFGYGHRCIALLELNQAHAVRIELGRASELAQRSHDPVTLQLTKHGLGLLYALEGRFDLAEELNAEAFRLGHEARDPNAFLAATALLMTIRRLQGRFEETTFEAGQAYVESLNLGASTFQKQLAIGRSLVGDAAGTRRYLDSLDISEWVPGVIRLWIACGVAEACAFVRDKARCRVLYEFLEPYAGRNANVGGIASWGSVSEFLGILAACLNRFDDAGRHFEEAISGYRSNGWTPLVAHAQAEYAAALAAERDLEKLDQARLHAGEALKTAKDLDMRAVRRKAQEALDKIEGRAEAASLQPRVRVTRRDRTRARVSAVGRRAVGRITQGRDDDELSRRFGSSLAQRTLFAAMARAFQPAMAFGFEGEIGFELRPAGEDGDMPPSNWWTLQVKGKKATAARGRSLNAALTVHADLPDFVRMAAGEPPVNALLEGRMSITGNHALLMRLGDMFGAIEPFEVLDRPPTTIPWDAQE